MAGKILKVKGVDCNSCSVLLDEVISEITGVKSVSADFKKGLVKVEAEENAFPGIKSAMEREGYKVIG